jgi:hypothetical protein
MRRVRARVTVAEPKVAVGRHQCLAQRVTAGLVLLENPVAAKRNTPHQRILCVSHLPFMLPVDAVGYYSLLDC